ncbi:hypothetical protein ACFROC_04360 [Nocardia tengchongensis]|uniref:hypothetical protein n=1 Tax=Nocardia tengchongensis TaxID=2055889 RepID=UPI0036991FB6
MKMLVLARSTVGIAAAAAMGVATIVSATTGSAALTIQPSQAYCVGTTYTITLPAADAAPMETNPVQSQIYFNYNTATQGVMIGAVPWVKGQDVTINWTPTQAVPTNISAVAGGVQAGDGFGSIKLSTDTFTVVQSAPTGASCTAPPAGTGTGTGSAGSIPVIGGLLSSLSAQK